MSYPKPTTQRYNMIGGINQKASSYTTGENQFLKIMNLDGFVPNALSSRPGWTSRTVVSASQPIGNIWEYEKFNGYSEIIGSAGGILYGFSSGGLRTLTGGPINTSVFDMLTFNDTLFAANGITMVTYTGVTTYSYGVPPILGFPTPSLIGSGNGFSFGVTTLIQYRANLIDIFGQEAAQNTSGSDGALSWADDAFVIRGPGSGISAIFMNSLPGTVTGFPGYFGFSAIKIYRAITSVGSGGAVPALLSDYKYLTTLPFGTTQFIDRAGTTNLILNDSPPNLFAFMYRWNGFASFIVSNRIPKYIETFNNTFFMAGFTATPSVLWHSEIGKPGEIQAEYNFEVRTDDGDRIRAMKEYNDQLIIFKFDSFHKLIGDNPDNFQLVQVSSEYGCVSNRAVVEAYENIFFLDKKGIVKYNGSEYVLISDGLEETFRRMNVVNATEKAVAVYDQYRNQVWFSFPIDSSTENNRTAVFDLITESLYEYEGFNPSGYGRVKSSLDREYVWFGNYSGYLGWFSASFMSDFGSGFTCLFLPKFEAPIGQNVEKMFRRHFLDVDPGVSRAIKIEVFRNYDEATVKATYISNTATFQMRHEMGVNGRACAVQVSYLSASFPIKINGYGLTYRYLREV